MINFFAAIQQAPSAPGATPAPAGTSASPQDLIRDIAPPVVIPMPWWQLTLIIGGAILLIAAIIWGVRRLQSRKSMAPPPTPRAVAIRDLEKLRLQVRTLDPYPFSIAVSDVLRS